MSKNRRQFLRAVGVGSLTATVAGCSGSSDDGKSNEMETSQGTPTSTPTPSDESSDGGDDSGGSKSPAVITMEAAGQDIWDASDAGHFYFKWTSGDFDVKVEVPSIENTHGDAKGGIMARASLDANDAHVFVRRRPPGFITLQWRPSKGEMARSLTSDSGRDEREYDSISAEYDWVRLVRKGTTIRGFASKDGENWKLLAELTPSEVELPNAVYLGLAGTSHNMSEAATIKFRNLSGVSPNKNVDIGNPAVKGSLQITHPPVLTNLEATNLGQSSATLTAELEALGESDQVDVQFEYREVMETKWKQTSTETLSEPGTITADISGLTSRRYYVFRATAAGSEDSMETPSTLFATASGSGESSAQGPDSVSEVDPGDGFADMAPWLDDQTPIIKITEPTRDQLERAFGVNGPRVVVFETSGTIDLGAEHISVPHDKLFLAGQTAPSPGITLARGQLAIAANDCVVQHIRSRPGDAGESTGWEPNAIETADATKNNIIDHCTGTWAVDETITAGYDTENTTISNCFIAEPLHDSTHHKGPHGYGTLIGNRAKNIAMMGNIWAFDTDRNPRLKKGSETVVVSNVVHHYQDGVWLDPETKSSIVGNVYRNPQTNQPNIFGQGTAYIDDNVLHGDADNPMVGGNVSQVSSRPLWPDGLTAIPSGKTYDHNLKNAGARPADRTAVDDRILEQIRNGTGGVIDSQTEVGGYPNLPKNTRKLDVPTTGLRAWLREKAVEVEQ